MAIAKNQDHRRFTRCAGEIGGRRRRSTRALRPLQLGLQHIVLFAQCVHFRTEIGELIAQLVDAGIHGFRIAGRSRNIAVRVSVIREKGVAKERVVEGAKKGTGKPSKQEWRVEEKQVIRVSIKIVPIEIELGPMMMPAEEML